MKYPYSRLSLFLSSIRLIPAIVLYLRAPETSAMRADLRRWAAIEHGVERGGRFFYLCEFIVLLSKFKAYRNVFYYRLGGRMSWIQRLCPPLESLEITAKKIGPGLYVQHGIATLIGAEEIGANFWVNQQVTIGYANKNDCPRIGDDVTVRPGAKIVGKVRIGNGATVGLNTVVLANVPDGATVFGVPGQIVWRRPAAK